MERFFIIFDRLDIKSRNSFPKKSTIFPIRSIAFNHEKLKANEVEGINNIMRKISAPISPIIEDRAKITSSPITPPKLLKK